ncbi:MAG: hypothetical protein OEY19_01170 [Gammaproteobacteria bacterium]|nr:hypothetical protein [Gammaproteobacteria bacterium]MDH5628667.1 hypothetical protein [Gammaproteobacteria bacterium]
MKQLITAGLIASMTVFSVAAEEPSFNFFEAGFVDYDFADGYTLRFNSELNENTFLTGSYESVSETIFGFDIDLNTTLFGVGYKFSQGDNSVTYGTVSYLDIEVDTPFGSGGDDGYQLGLGYRNQYSENSQFYTELNHMNVVSSATELVLGIRHKMSDDVGMYAEYKTNDFGDDGYGIGVSFSF